MTKDSEGPIRWGLLCSTAFCTERLQHVRWVSPFARREFKAFRHVGMINELLVDRRHEA